MTCFLYKILILVTYLNGIWKWQKPLSFFQIKKKKNTWVLENWFFKENLCFKTAFLLRRFLITEAHNSLPLFPLTVLRHTTTWKVKWANNRKTMKLEQPCNTWKAFINITGSFQNYLNQLHFDTQICQLECADNFLSEKTPVSFKARKQLSYK